MIWIGWLFFHLFPWHRFLVGFLVSGPSGPSGPTGPSGPGVGHVRAGQVGLCFVGVTLLNFQATFPKSNPFCLEGYWLSIHVYPCLSLIFFSVSFLQPSWKHEPSTATMCWLIWLEGWVQRARATLCVRIPRYSKWPGRRHFGYRNLGCVWTMTFFWCAHGSCLWVIPQATTSTQQMLLFHVVSIFIRVPAQYLPKHARIAVKSNLTKCNGAWLGDWKGTLICLADMSDIPVAMSCKQSIVSGDRVLQHAFAAFCCPISGLSLERRIV
jgi:hypothetical protein